MIVYRLQIFVAVAVTCMWATRRATAAPIAGHLPPAPAQLIANIGDAMQFLEHYGYAKVLPNALMTEHEVFKPIREFQRFAHLNETGELDDATIEKMNEPRCGMPDLEGDIDGDDESGRRKRFFAPVRWYKTELTYRISQYTADMAGSIVDGEIAAAFKLWSDVTPLKFTQVDPNAQADIDVMFAPPYIPHRDGPFYWSAFDGPSKILAHAFYPTFYGDIAGDAHFDDGETWTANTYLGTNLYLVAAHEFGHSLGLGHSNVYGSLMYPYHMGFRYNYQLPSDDIAGIQYLYGPKPEEPDPTEAVNPNPNPNTPQFCPTAIDTITETKDGSTYVFQGGVYWRLTDGFADAGYPKSIRDDWQGLAGNFDASFTASNYWFWQNDEMRGKTWFFKDNLVWRFENQVMDGGYPKFISTEFVGLPDSIDGAFEYAGNGQTYFFKDGFFYMINWKKEVVGPFSMTNWRGIPTEIDAVFQASDNFIYFFNGNQYYKFQHDSFVTLSGYPRTIGSDFIACHSALTQPDNVQQHSDDVALAHGAESLALNDGNVSEDDFTVGGENSSGRALVPSVFLVITALSLSNYHARSQNTN